jgi:Flp pilus assembly protein TadD
VAQVTCSRCFRIFEVEHVRPGVPPLCGRCAPARAAAPAGAAPRERDAAAVRRPIPPRRRARPTTVVAGALAVTAAVGLAAGGAVWLHRPQPAAPAPPSPVEEAVAEWRTRGLAEAPAPGTNARVVADRKIAAGRAALRADLPQRAGEAVRAFRDALAADPARLEAIAGYATAFADAAGDDPQGDALRAAHDLVRWAMDRAPGRPDVLAAFARLLLLAPSASNDAEALQAAAQAAAAAPGDASARLAEGLARLDREPEAAARALEAGVQADPGDRRLLTAAARARWRAGDPAGALALAARRLALDPAQPDALALDAEIRAALGRDAEARATLERWAALDPASPLPPLLMARLAYQVEGDLPRARALLEAARAHVWSDFVAARILTHAAALARASGDTAAADQAVAEALRRVPASGSAWFQRGLLAFEREEAPAVRQAAGVVGDRGGSIAARRLAARAAELSATADDAIAAWRALADAAPRDPAVILEAGGALARLGASGPALELAERAARREPREAALRRVLTDYWAGPGPLAEAARRYADLAAAEPSTAGRALAAAADCELLLGHTVPAERLARRALPAAPQAPFPLALLGEISLLRGQPQDALGYARGALELRPGDPVALLVRARALAAAGKRLEAIRAEKEALRAAPDLAAGRLELARLLVADGRPAEARPVLDALAADEPALPIVRAELAALGPRP